MLNPRQPWDDWRMYLAYVDESESHVSQSERFMVVAGVLAPESTFRKLEQILSFLREFEAPADQRESFAEFHTSDLYGGHGLFTGVARASAMKIISKQAHYISRCMLRWCFASIDIAKHKDSEFGNARPVTVGFRKCLGIMEAWMSTNAPTELAVAVFDDTHNREISRDLQVAFRDLRRPYTILDNTRGRLEHFHDDLYFGDSAFSCGLQMADICAFLARRHEEKKADTESMFQTVSEVSIDSRWIDSREL